MNLTGKPCVITYLDPNPTEAHEGGGGHAAILARQDQERWSDTFVAVNSSQFALETSIMDR